ncbi:MAG: pyrroline-5-carboxylate reductase [Cohaesibacteraceae bacterium]|nr:pyrroline-5-carboxylate reductase [Cohaesibacteraceae bacterium]MBL4875315.1 pyrroline-5-carboxylate reductase [Cohaesibacteraceae bacterium]MBL4877136.1 pyrroline-5-carboxylate reductase [Cohaesibacteraceae bacterium]
MKLSSISLTLIGAGKMGGAMLAGWLERGLHPDNVTAIDPGLPDEMASMAKKHGFRFVSSADQSGITDIVVVAVKPQILEKVLSGIRPVIGPDTTVVSVVAGKNIAVFQQILGENCAIVRTIPNTPSQVGRGMTAGFASSNVSGETRAIVEELLTVIGEFSWVENESLIDTATAVSGSGPAYVFYLAECLAKAGVEAGMTSQMAEKFARQTVAGAGELLYHSDIPAAQLRQNVTSPNGTTAEALAVLMADDGMLPLMTKAVAAAKRRSEELS